MRCLIGLGTELAHLSDEHAIFAIEQWARLHPARPAGDSPRVLDMRDIDWGAMAERRRIALDVIKKIIEVLTPDEIVDLEVIYYIGRNKEFCDYYERNLESTRNQHLAEGNLASEVQHLIDKTNFQEAFMRGVSKLGRPDLADNLSRIMVKARILP